MNVVTANTKRILQGVEATRASGSTAAEATTVASSLRQAANEAQNPNALICRAVELSDLLAATPASDRGRREELMRRASALAAANDR